MQNLRFFIFVLVAINAQAQEGIFSVGINTGANFSRIETHKNIQENFLHTQRIQLAAHMKYQYNSLHSLKAKIIYDNKGAKITNIVFIDSTGNTTGIVDLHLNYTYITLPVFWDYIFITRIGRNKFRMFAGAGMYGSMLVNRTDKIKGPNITTTALKKSSSYESKWDYGITGHTEAEYPVAKNIKLNAEIILSYGLNNTVAKPTQNNIHPYYTTAKHRVLSICFGIDYVF